VVHLERRGESECAEITVIAEKRNGLRVATPQLLKGVYNYSEEFVFEALCRLTREKTAIVIAHRLTTVRKADAIFVLQDGGVVESGARDELLTRGGLYAYLYEIQFSDKAMIAAPTF